MYHVSFDIDLLRNPYPGKYIALEGIDGSGKSTQVELLQACLEAMGKKVVVTSEPKIDSTIGKMIHNALQAKTYIPPAALQYLYSADRVINQENTIVPALQEGAIVLSHRVFWSAVPYGLMDKLMSRQDGGYDYNKHTHILIAQGILSLYHQFIAPDKTFYLDVSVDTAMSRLSHMKKIKEVYEKKDTLEKIAQGYQLLLQEFPHEFFVIDAEKSEKEVTDKIMENLEVILKK